MKVSLAAFSLSVVIASAPAFAPAQWWTNEEAQAPAARAQASRPTHETTIERMVLRPVAQPDAGSGSALNTAPRSESTLEAEEGSRSNALYRPLESPKPQQTVAEYEVVRPRNVIQIGSPTEKASAPGTGERSVAPANAWRPQVNGNEEGTKEGLQWASDASRRTRERDTELTYNQADSPRRESAPERVSSIRPSSASYRTWPSDRWDQSNRTNNPYHPELRWWDAGVSYDAEDGVVNVKF